MSDVFYPDGTPFRYMLRAHHGMCLAYYRGVGYSEAFTARMTDLVGQVEKNPLVCVVDHVDYLCAVCPHNRGGACESYEKILRYDTAVLRACGLESGQILPYADFQKAVYDHILLAGKRPDICGNCAWNRFCEIPPRPPLFPEFSNQTP